MTLLIISFVAGVLTILAPCILPLLPVIVGHSITDSTLYKRRLATVLFSLGGSIILFTLILKASTLLINIPQDFWKWISGGIIFIFGMTMLLPELWERISIMGVISRKSNVVLTKGYLKDSIWGDVIIGASLGPIFSACSPTYFVILATVLPATPVLGIIYLLTYTFGLCLALLVVALLGQKIATRLGGVSDPRGWFKRIIGIIFIIVAIGIFSGYDKELQIKLLDSGFLDVTKIEQRLLEFDTEKKEPTQENESSSELLEKKLPTTTEISSMLSKEIKTEDEDFLSLAQKKTKFPLASDISTPDGFINTNGKPISIKEYLGKKVVLLDIWTYSCINCQRTIPYLNEWYKKYEERGLVIIGLHTPEFAFERVKENVEKAVLDFDIKYPVVLDNDFSTWMAYENRFWPRKYLIDIDGYIVYDHAGEGAYMETEQAIQKALRERVNRLGMKEDMPTTISKPANVVEVDQGKVRSPEVYFGSARNTLLENGSTGTSGKKVFSLPTEFSPNKLYLSGAWNITSEYAKNENPAEIIFNYNAKNVYMAAGSEKNVEVEIYQDEKFKKKITIKEEKLYSLIEGKDYGEHTLRIKIISPGLMAFTFTFG
ncbi:MAG: cytochrome c biogenesis protein CcdA [bacterium]|nr:cytochrome c biogenesis protein CcdA [bacterium]